MRFAPVGSFEAIDAEDADRPGIGLDQPHHHAQCRGLAGSVWPQQGVKLAGPHDEIEAVDRRLVKTFAKALISRAGGKGTGCP